MWLRLQGDRWPHGYSVHSERSLWWLMPGGRFGDRSPPVGSRPPALQQATSMKAPPEPQEPPQRIPASPYSGCFPDKPWPRRLLGQGAPSFSQTSTHLPADIKPGLCVSASLLGPPHLHSLSRAAFPSSRVHGHRWEVLPGLQLLLKPQPQWPDTVLALAPFPSLSESGLTDPRGSLVTETVSS